MRKGPYIEDIQEKEPVEGLYLVRDKNNGITKNGKPYIALNLSDKTGVVKGRVWDNATKLDPCFDQGDVVYLKSFSVLYQGEMQLNIHAINRVGPDDADPRDFMSASALDPEQCCADIQACIAQGEFLDVDPKTFGATGTAHIPGFRRFYRHVLLGRFHHHAAVAFDHCGDILFDAMKLLGIESVFTPIDKALYEGENPFG